MAAGAAAQDFTCAGVRPSTSLKPEYARDGNLEVCEGFFDRDVSQPYLEVVSLTAQPREALAALGAGPVRIAAPVTGATPPWLRIQPLRIAVLYRIDALLRPGHTWNPRSLQESTELGLADLGFLVTPSRSNDGTLMVIPVQIGTPAAASQTAYATVRVSTLVPKLRWRAYPTATAQAQNPAWQDANDMPLYPWSWQTIAIPLAGGAQMQVDVSAADDNGEPLASLSFKIAKGAHGGD
jgi:hypothetical protein